MKQIAVLGSGSWGTALACLLNENGHGVRLWSFKKEEAENIAKYRENKEFLPKVSIAQNIFITNNAEQAVLNADMVVMAVPSKFVESTIKMFAPFLSLKDSSKGQIIVNVAKGLEETSLRRLSEVIEKNVPNCKVGVLSGPSHAEEVGKKLPATCVASSKHKEVSEQIQNAFINEMFRVYANNDIIGVELGGALKNVIALAAGISDGLGFGDNAKAAIMTRGMAEIARLGVAMGASPHTFSGLTGIGDLIVTCTSMHSRNRRAGILLAQGKTLEETIKEVHMVVEGINTAAAALKLANKYNVEMPITAEINKVLFKGKDPKATVYDLMNRDAAVEAI